ncbi:hypothetical protein E2562_038965 [Oryza meyeriana var. granulata]|uniref:Uncharacterized protein n=1 Tax=Oryza meyeriana var. granulata TaxID=110450 RepID=A0A6G1FGW1_9ORYZ|nr:hypothetical protein E2562_038965 [Oryza meyeriana var. granulata]
MFLGLAPSSLHCWPICTSPRGNLYPAASRQIPHPQPVVLVSPRRRQAAQRSGGGGAGGRAGGLAREGAGAPRAAVGGRLAGSERQALSRHGHGGDGDGVAAAVAVRATLAPCCRCPGGRLGAG